MEIKGPPSSQRLTDRPQICGIRFSERKVSPFFRISNGKATGGNFCSDCSKRRDEKKKGMKKIKSGFFLPSFLHILPLMSLCALKYLGLWETQLPNIDMLLKNGASWLSSVRKMLPKSRTRVYVSIIPVIQSASTARPRLPLQPRSSDLTLLRLLHPLPRRNILCLSLRWKKLVLKPQGKSR